MEHNAILSSVITAIVFGISFFLIWRWMDPAHRDDKGKVSGYDKEVIWHVFFMSSVVAVLASLPADKIVNREYYKHADEVIENKKSDLQDKGYELWSKIKERPIEKVKIDSCLGDAILVDSKYNEVSIDESIEGVSDILVYCRQEAPDS